MLKKFTLEFLNSLLVYSGCVGSGIAMMKQYPASQFAWIFSANFILQFQQKFTVRFRIHIFTKLLKMG
jgi:hypothetical protein